MTASSSYPFSCGRGEMPTQDMTVSTRCQHDNTLCQQDINMTIRQQDTNMTSPYKHDNTSCQHNMSVYNTHLQLTFSTLLWTSCLLEPIGEEVGGVESASASTITSTVTLPGETTHYSPSTDNLSGFLDSV